MKETEKPTMVCIIYFWVATASFFSFALCCVLLKNHVDNSSLIVALQVFITLTFSLMWFAMLISLTAGWSAYTRHCPQVVHEYIEEHHDSLCQLFSR